MNKNKNGLLYEHIPKQKQKYEWQYKNYGINGTFKNSTYIVHG